MTCLLYHDVLGDPRRPESGFAGADADIYKLTLPTFEAHLDAIAHAGLAVFNGGVSDLSAWLAAPERVFLTFDDGGASAWPVIAECLERRGWRGLFFITTGRLDQPGFLRSEELRNLAATGHIVGSHSVNHPPRMSALDLPELHREWGESRKRLEGVLQQPVTIGSVPGGYFSPAVALAASAEGYDLLFTSEPRRHPWRIQGTTLAGRFSVVAKTPVNRVAELAVGQPAACLRQALGWNAKKLVKRAGGAGWLAFRRRYWTWRNS
jgi:peptidoglycan/xylan/chitin deacetylase (PgdA/CDA1 family)